MSYGDRTGTASPYRIRRYGACAGDVATPCCWLIRYGAEFTETHRPVLLGEPRYARQPMMERLQIMPDVDFIFTAKTAARETLYDPLASKPWSSLAAVHIALNGNAVEMLISPNKFNSIYSPKKLVLPQVGGVATFRN